MWKLANVTPLFKKSDKQLIIINDNTFHEMRCRSSRYTNSFFPDAITSWNNVITHFDNIPSINIVKDHILSLIRPKGKTFLAYMILQDCEISFN